MPLEPHEMFMALRDHHVYDFSHRQLQVGALMAVGYTEKQMA